MITSWTRTAFASAVDGGRRTVVSNDDIVQLAKSEGVSSRLVTGRVKARKAFASAVASYEPQKAMTARQARMVGYGCFIPTDGF